MQRLFTTFAPGLPGLALFLLRASVAIALAAESYDHRQQIAGIAVAIALLVSMALLAGFLTPIAAVACIALHVLSWLDIGIGSAAVAIIIVLDATALALLGPGAYSIDSWRYGPREVILPPR